MLGRSRSFHPGSRSVDTLLDIILAHEVISGGLVFVSLLLAGKAIIQFSREATELRSRLVIVDSRLEKVRAELPDKRKRVEDLTKAVAAIRPREDHLRQYYNVIMDIKVQVERQEQEQEEQERIKHERDKAKRDIGL